MLENSYISSQELEILQKNTHKPFIKWAGGKRGLVDSILPFIPKQFNNYFELFLGGGALFFALQSSNFLKYKQIYLNDKNTELMNVYKVIKKYPSKLLEILKIMQHSHNKEYFYTIRNLDRLDSFKNGNMEEINNILKIYNFTDFNIFKAARFIYLNKTCFNGLCRYNSKGQFNTPVGSYKKPIIYNKDIIMNAYSILQNTNLYCADFTEITKLAKKDDFIYFDPPYYPINKTSSFVSYTDVFLEKEHKSLYNIFKELDAKGVKVLQSNSSTPFIENLYKDFTIIPIKAKRVINCKGSKRGEITEFLIKGNYE